MELKDVVSIAGISGLHKIIGKSKSGLILETIGTGKRFPTAIQDKVSVLEDISMFTEDGDVRLVEVFHKLWNKDREGTAIPSGAADLKTQREFVKAVVNIDNERVYDSDIRKLLNWYKILKDEIDFSKLPEEPKEDEAGEGDEADDKPKAAKQTAPKTHKKEAPKNAAPKTNTKGAGGSKTTYRPKSV